MGIKQNASDELNIDKNIKDKKDLTDQNTPDDLKISNNFLEKTEDKGRDKLPQLKYFNLIIKYLYLLILKVKFYINFELHKMSSCIPNS